MLDALPVNFLFRMTALVSAPISIQHGPQGSRMIVPAVGGTVEGPNISGKVLGGIGAEWATVRPDGSMKADVRLVLETNDGAAILMAYNGIATVVGESLTVRIAPLFETGDPQYAWLNKVQAVGLGAPTDIGINYDVYQIL